LTEEAKAAPESVHQDVAASQRVSGNATAELAEVKADADETLLSKREADTRVQQAQDLFAQVNQEFKQKMQEMSEARSRGDEITVTEKEALVQAQEDAQMAQHKLDRALEVLRVADTAENGAMSGNDDVHQLIHKKAQETDKAPELGEELTEEAKAAPESVHQDVAASQRVSGNATAELAEVKADADETLLSKREADTRVQQAQDLFAQVNQEFKQKMQEMSEARSRGDEITVTEKEALVQAQEDAQMAQHKLDRALEVLRVADTAENGAMSGNDEAIAPDVQRAMEESEGKLEVNGPLSESEAERDLLEAQKHFDQVNEVFVKKLQEQEEDTLTGEELRLINTAHEDFRRAQEALGAKASAFQATVQSKIDQERKNLEEGRAEAEAMMLDATAKVEALRVKLEEAKTMGTSQEELVEMHDHFSQLADEAKVGQRILDTFVHALRQRESSQVDAGGSSGIHTPAVDEARRSAEALHLQAEAAALKWLEERRKTKTMEQAAAKLADNFHTHQDD